MHVAVVVKIPTQLRTLTDGRDQVEADGHSLQQILDALENAHPGLQKRVLDDAGKLRRFVNVYVDGEDVRFLQGLETQVPERSEVAIIPAVAGGA
jgi:molybdopterin converting factor small subunit